MVIGGDAGAPLAALVRILSVTSLRAVAAGIRFVMFSEFVVMGVHLIPFVLNSIRFDTPVTISLRVSSTMPVGAALEAKTICVIPTRITQKSKIAASKHFFNLFTIKALLATVELVFKGILPSLHPCVFTPYTVIVCL
jgi:hypothetical protein